MANQSYHNCFDHVKLLLEHRVSLELTNGEGETPIYTAIRTNSWDCFRLLVDAGAKTKAVVSEFFVAADLLSRRAKTMRASATAIGRRR